MAEVEERLQEELFKQQEHLAKRYTKVSVLGRGTYGTVYKGIDSETGMVVAIKVIDLESTEDDLQSLMKEIIALRDCDSRYVTKYFASFTIGPELWIIMEYLGGGSAHDFLQPKFKIGIEEEYIRIILREVTHGLAYLHSLKKIHRDIKAANVLLHSNGDVKLADFGVVGQLSETMDKRMTMIGSPYWMAPEVIMQSAYDTGADVWSLGILCIELANGLPPYAEQHPYPAMLAITKNPPPTLPDGNEWSDELHDFVAKCLTKDTQDRTKITDLVNHAAITKAGKTGRLVELIKMNQVEEDTVGHHLSPSMSDQLARKRGHRPNISMDFRGSNNLEEEDEYEEEEYEDDSDEFDDDRFGTMVSTAVPPIPDDNAEGSDEEDDRFGTMISVSKAQQEELSTAITKDAATSTAAESGAVAGALKTAADVDINKLKGANPTHYRSMTSPKKMERKSQLTIPTRAGGGGGNKRVSKRMSTHPKMRPSVSRSEMGIQTERQPVFNKATQTHEETLSGYAGLYNDLDQLFDVVKSHLNAAGLPHLESLKAKVQKLSRLKITQRKSSSLDKIESGTLKSITVNSGEADTLEERRRRIQELRERRKQKMEAAASRQQRS